MEEYRYLGTILSVAPSELQELDAVMEGETGKSGVVRSLAEENRERVEETLRALGLGSHASSLEVHKALRDAVLKHERLFFEHIDSLDGKSEFEKIVTFANKATSAKRGFFLKKELAGEILRKRPPQNVLKFLGAQSIDQVLAQYDVTEVFASLRFLESQEWMHETFEEAYSGLTAEDFEERDIEARVLSNEWQRVAEQFVAKKHHNVSHLKEFGVIFLNPIRMNIPGKFLRDAPLFLHYFHEVEFYAKLFRKYAEGSDFAEKLKMLLRGDVPEKKSVGEGEWLIVQRYLWKENPKDPRLFLPRVNPESLHWARGERDLVEYCAAENGPDLSLWRGLDWVAGVFAGGGEGSSDVLISFDLEDVAFSLASFMEGKNEVFSYHQREAMWTKLFERYAGGQEEMEKLLVAHFDKGVVAFKK